MFLIFTATLLVSMLFSVRTLCGDSHKQQRNETVGVHRGAVVNPRASVAIQVSIYRKLQAIDFWTVT